MSIKKMGLSTSNEPFIGTFHSFSASILRREAKILGYKSNFSIFDDEDATKVMKDILKEMAPDEDAKPDRILGQISKHKNAGLDVEMFAEKAEKKREIKLLKLWQEYEARLMKYNAVDFDNLLIKTRELLRRFPDVLEKYQERFKYILVDEYQDTNQPQYDILKLLAKKYRNICVVGDIDQAIYGFRGGNFRNLLSFEKDWPDAKLIRLEENYRSTKNIVRAADEVIGKNKWRIEKKMFTSNSDGSLIEIIGLADEREEAEFIAKKIAEKKNGGGSLQDIAVLLRTNAQSRIIEEIFLEYGIPYQLIGGFKFYKRREVLDLVAYLKFISNPADRISLRRIINVPARGIGPATFRKYFSSSSHSDDALLPKQVRDFWEIIKTGTDKAKSESVSSLLNWLIKKIKYKEYLEPESEEGSARWENVQELASVATAFDDFPAPHGLEEFLKGVSLMQEIDTYDPERDRATIMTMHSAKGLEFPTVIVAGCEEGIFPHERALFRPEELEEERRLCYVALTRAKKELCLTFARHRLFRGSFSSNPPSRFLGDIPAKITSFLDQEIFSDSNYQNDGEEDIRLD